MGRALRALALAGVAGSAAAARCCCDLAAMAAPWGGVALKWEANAGSSCGRNDQNGTLTADAAPAAFNNFAALGTGVGAWSGGYDYFRVEMNFSGNPVRQ